MNNKIIRTICLFSDNPTQESVNKLTKLRELFVQNGYNVQTIRLCSNNTESVYRLDKKNDGSLFLTLGELTIDEAKDNLGKLLEAKNISFNISLTDVLIDKTYAGLLEEIIRKNPNKTFNFTYTANNVPSSPFFPSATYKTNGFSVGLQSTDISEGCQTIEEWLEQMQAMWIEINNLVENYQDFLGIDTSVAPLFHGSSSFIAFIKRTGLGFEESVTTDNYLKITKYLKNQTIKSVGLCGLMFPCLEDFELAKEYELGNFSIERNVFLSLHSGLGIDTYPIGLDEKPDRIIEILKLIQGLAAKYTKPLSIRFVSDGKANIGEKTNFQNQYLKDVIIRPL